MLLSAAIRSFAPVARADARVLILGSMPGAASLAAGRYYAHPRNQFWSVLGALFGFDPVLAYPQRLELLQHHRIALWDVLAQCRRRGSLDQNIHPDSIQFNDFADFFSRYPALSRVCCNGQAAARWWQHWLRQHTGHRLQLSTITLPSTSPAHAGMRFEQKLEHWRAGLVADALPAP